jgi:hypothetical protein
MNKQTVEELIKIANTLDNTGYYKETNMPKYPIDVPKF